MREDPKPSNSKFKSDHKSKYDLRDDDLLDAEFDYEDEDYDDEDYDEEDWNQDHHFDEDDYYGAWDDD